MEKKRDDPWPCTQLRMAKKYENLRNICIENNSILKVGATVYVASFFPEFVLLFSIVILNSHSLLISARCVGRTIQASRKVAKSHVSQRDNRSHFKRHGINWEMQPKVSSRKRYILVREKNSIKRSYPYSIDVASHGPSSSHVLSCSLGVQEGQVTPVIFVDTKRVA